MTRQEAIKILNKYDLNFCDIDGNPIPPHDLAEACDMAIEALAQEPKPSEVARDIATIIENEQDMRVIALQQEPKRGKWYIREYEFFTCDQCGEDVLSFAESTSEAKRKLKNGDFPNYCPNCGARMESDEQ